MDGNEQSKIVAAYQTDMKIQAVAEQEHRREQERRSLWQRLFGGKKGKK